MTNQRQVINENYQFSIFPNNFIETDLKNLLEKLKTIPKFSNTNNKIIPVPTEAPREIPRIILESTDKDVLVEISFDKVTITWKNISDSSGWDVNGTVLKDDISILINKFLSTNYIKRIGFVKKIFFDYSDLESEMVKKITTKNITKDLQEFNFGLTYNFSLPIFNECNKVKIIEKAKTIKDNKDVITITTDINTHQDRDINWIGVKNINLFIDQTMPFLEKNTIVSDFF